jgi:uncharacterized coiled-coil DUF342 family protein
LSAMAPKTAPKAAPKAAAPKPATKAAAAKPKVKKEKTPEEEEKPKLQAPDWAAFDEQVAQIQKDIDKLEKKKKDLADKISERSGGRDEFHTKRVELRAQLDELSEKMNQLQAQKDEINKAVGNKREEGREMRSQLNTMKKSIGFTSETEIDERIASIEFKLWTESVPLKDEKKLLAEIQMLKKNRPKVAQVKHMEEKVNSFDPGMSMRDSIGAINEEMAKFREAKQAVSAKMKELMDSRNEQLGDLPQILEQKNAIGQQIAEKIKERNAARDAFKEKEREYNAYLNEQRKARQEKAAEERAERQKEYDLKKKMREVEKLDEQPFVSEITLIEQTIFFCKSLAAPKAEAKKEEKKEINLDNPDGTQVLLRKEDREEEYFFAPTKGKKATKKVKAASDSTAAKPIKHNAETFRLFDQLKLDAPITTEEIPSLIEKLEEMLANYNAKVKEWEEKREDMKKEILEGLANAEAKDDGDKKDDESKQEE